MPAFLGQIIANLVLALGFMTLLQEQVRQQLSELSRTDPLTGLLNRRGLLDLLERDLERARRTQRSLSLALFDIDHFKRINDRNGHAAGDEVLRAFAGRMANESRKGDIAARWGGEEFVLVMPETSLPQATQVAERIRLATRITPLASSTGTITVSGGVAELNPAADTTQSVDQLVKVADRRMYQAKLSRDTITAVDN